jgi:RNA polymerase sigma-70 factor (ECF subfamily)
MYNKGDFMGWIERYFNKYLFPRLDVTCGWWIILGQIVALYDRLLRIQPSPVVQLNRAVAIAMCDGPEAGLTQIDAVLERGELANYYLGHSARTDMYRRLGRTAELRASYEKALALTRQEPERQFLQERIRQLK